MLIEKPEMLVGVDAFFLSQVRLAVNPLPARYVMTYGIRTQAQEDALYAQGRTTPGPIVTWTHKSAHVAGLAIDVAILSPAGTPTWDYSDPAWGQLIEAIRASEWLHSGADFPKGETDEPHIEALWWAFPTAKYGPPANSQ